MSTAIIYHYFEVNKIYKDNFIFFLNCAIDADANYFIFISGTCSVDLPSLKNVEYFHIQNKNNDFGAVLEFYKLPNIHNFQSYVFVNSSVRGPFLPNYYKKKWYEVFTGQLSEKIGLIGSSINFLSETSPHSTEFQDRHNFTPPFIHVQTTAYALSLKAFDVLRKNNFHTQVDRLKKNEVIADYEILMSQILMNAGFSISSLLPTLSSFQANQEHLNLNKTSKNGDVLYKNAFYGRSLSPIECLFVKTNRDMISEVDLNSYTLTTLIEKYKNHGLDVNGSNLLDKSMAGVVSRPPKLLQINIKLLRKISRLLTKILTNKKHK